MTPYCNARHLTGLGAKNVGWLSAHKPCPTRPPSVEFLDALWWVVTSTLHDRRYSRFMRTRGFHCCDLCQPPPASILRERYGDHTEGLGSGEIRVFHPNGLILAAPDLVFHYIYAHHYAPPTEFVEAVILAAEDQALFHAQLTQHLEVAMQQPRKKGKNWRAPYLSGEE